MVRSEKGSPAFSFKLKREGICVFVQDAGALGKKLKDGVKLLGQGSGNFSLPLQIEVMISSIRFRFITLVSTFLTGSHFTSSGKMGDNILH